MSDSGFAPSAPSAPSTPPIRPGGKIGRATPSTNAGENQVIQVEEEIRAIDTAPTSESTVYGDPFESPGGRSNGLASSPFKYRNPSFNEHTPQAKKDHASGENSRTAASVGSLEILAYLQVKQDTGNNVDLVLPHDFDPDLVRDLTNNGFKTPQGTELLFEKQVFLAFAKSSKAQSKEEDLLSWNKLVVDDRDVHILETYGDYAIALVRQKSMDKFWFGDFLGPASPGSTFDHAVAILRRTNQNGQWVWAYEACCAVIEFKAREQLIRNLVNEDSKPNEAFAQVTKYAATLVLPSLAYLGLSKCMEKIYVAVISFRKVGDQKLASSEGFLSPPIHCGDAYKYRFASFNKENDEYAIDSYLCHVYHGITIARAGIRRLQEGLEEYPMVPLSGGGLPFQGSGIIELRSTAVRPADRIKVRFGDVWTGTMLYEDIRSLEGKLHPTKCAMMMSAFELCGNSSQAEGSTSVFIKVSNALVHGWVVNPVACDYALRLCSEVLTNATSLLFAGRATAGMVTIMENLHQNGRSYVTLTPMSWGGKGMLGVLWDAFTSLVKTVLIPMAEVTVIFTDLRFGHDIVGNIMANGLPNNYGKEGQPPLKLELIDFDSLSTYAGYKKPEDMRYIIEKEDSDAMAFVFVQVFLMGIAWMVKFENISFDATGWSNQIYNELDTRSKLCCTECDVIDLLSVIREDLDKNFDSKTVLKDILGKLFKNKGEVSQINKKLATMRLQKENARRPYPNFN